MSARRALAAPQTACRSGRLPDEGAWDFRTTDRLTTTTDLKGIPAPTHSVPPRRKTIVDTRIRQTLLSLMPDMNGTELSLFSGFFVVEFPVRDFFK